jgi:hypothetical protein
MENKQLALHLSNAETYWKESRTQEALEQYDLALQLTSTNESKTGEILLGRGYAILNSSDPTVVQDQALQRQGLHNLETAKEISVKLGNDRAALFVQQIIDQKGKLHVHDTAGGKKSGGCCKEESKANENEGDEHHCSSHDAVAKTSAAAAAAAAAAALVDMGTDMAAGLPPQPSSPDNAGGVGGDGGGGRWTSAMDERLISLVAKLGVKRWEEVSMALKELEEGVAVLFSVQQLEQRWAYLKPFVKYELEHGDGMDKERSCGHTCNTCPTRSTCELHDAVDIEDLVLGRV